MNTDRIRQYLKTTGSNHQCGMAKLERPKKAEKSTHPQFGLRASFVIELRDSSLRLRIYVHRHDLRSALFSASQRLCGLSFLC